jgi:hypothetical protein
MMADQVGLAVEVGVPIGDVPLAVAVVVEDPGVGLAVLVDVAPDRACARGRGRRALR